MTDLYDDMRYIYSLAARIGGSREYELYLDDVRSFPSCKEYLDKGEEYDDCMINKLNCSLERLIERVRR